MKARLQSVSMPVSPRATQPVQIAGPESNQKAKAAEIVADQLRREIVTGNLRPGDKLLPEHLLQEQFGISRPTLREAMRMLEAESLVRISRGQHGGATVTVPNKGVLARQVGVFLQREGTTLRDLWQARMIVEPTAASLVATGPGRGAALEAFAANLEAARANMEDPQEYAALSTRFSELMVEHCGNNTLRLFALLLEDIVRRQYTHDHVANYAAPVVGMQIRTLALRAREKLLQLVTAGKGPEAAAHWRFHLESIFQQISAYHAGMPIDVLRPRLEARNPAQLLRPPGLIKRKEATRAAEPIAIGTQRKAVAAKRTAPQQRKRAATSKG
jgi:DNA-binding FadR family transcriptional regulator